MHTGDSDTAGRVRAMTRAPSFPALPLWLPSHWTIQSQSCIFLASKLYCGKFILDIKLGSLHHG